MGQPVGLPHSRKASSAAAGSHSWRAAPGVQPALDEITRPRRPTISRGNLLDCPTHGRRLQPPLEVTPSGLTPVVQPALDEITRPRRPMRRGDPPDRPTHFLTLSNPMVDCFRSVLCIHKVAFTFLFI